MLTQENDLDHQITSYLDRKICLILSEKLNTFQNIKVENNFYLSDNASMYQDSIHITKIKRNDGQQYVKALCNVRSEVQNLNLLQHDIDSLNRTLDKIHLELQKSSPQRMILKTCFELIPPSVIALESIIQLGRLIGIS
ncbi:hypothetical protein KXJ74_10665 [Acinetobacter johnsonii]|jgi:Tfp pilus assembly protein PilN|nr:hypothetical protein KXJ74_10665 [Acinetobacter johnsonii]